MYRKIVYLKKIGEKPEKSEKRPEKSEKALRKALRKAPPICFLYNIVGLYLSSLVALQLYCIDK